MNAPVLPTTQTSATSISALRMIARVILRANGRHRAPTGLVAKPSEHPDPV